MRHGRKTTATKVDGYKSHQRTQSVPPAAGARLITAVGVPPANAADGATTVQTAVAPHTRGVAPVPPANNRAGRFPKGRFTLDLAAETVTCPQGETVGYGAVRPRRRDGRRVVRWAAATCAACPLRAPCVGAAAPGVDGHAIPPAER